MDDKSPNDYIDDFISECLLPTTASKKVMVTDEVYKVYEKYCEYAGIPTSSRVGFGKKMSTRFQRVRRAGRPNYYCEINPRVLTRGEQDED